MQFSNVHNTHNLDHNYYVVHILTFSVPVIFSHFELSVSLVPLLKALDKYIFLYREIIILSQTRVIIFVFETTFKFLILAINGIRVHT